MGKAVSSKGLGATPGAGTAQPCTGTQEGQGLQGGCAVFPPSPGLLGMF